MNTIHWTLRINRARIAQLVVLTVALALILFSVYPVLASRAKATFTGYGPGYSDVYLDEDAGSYLFSIEGANVTAYCVQMTKPFDSTGDYYTSPLGSEGIPGDGRAAWLATSHSSVGTPLADTASEHAATQVAIWTFTDGATINETNVESPSIRERATELAAAGAGHSIGARPASFNLDVTGSIVGDQAEFVATAATDSGTPLPGTSVTFDFPGTELDTTLTTGGDGTATVSVDAPAPGESLDVSVSASFKVSAGTLLVPESGKQILVTGSSVNVNRSDATSVESAATSTTLPPATTTTVPGATTTSTTSAVPGSTSTTVAPTTTIPTVTPTTQPPSPTTTVNAPEELPYTGGEFPYMLLIGGAIAAVVAIVAYRRTRI